MGYRELIESLRKDGENRVHLLWNEVKAQAEKTRSEVSGMTKQIREEHRKRQAQVVKEQEEGIISEADHKARMIRLSAEKVLSVRLFPLALSCLHELRRHTDVFDSLAGELPDIQWKEVRVNPEDIKIAQGFFSDSKIIPDDNITGGLEVITEDKKMRIINTFEKRLEMAWEDMLPWLVKDIYKEI